MGFSGHQCLRLLGLLLLLHHALATTSTTGDPGITSSENDTTITTTKTTTTTSKTTTTTQSGGIKAPKTKFSTNDWLVVGVTSAIPVIVFVATIILGICRVKQEQNELEKKMSRIQSEGQDNPGFEM